MAQRLRSHTFAREADYHVRWGRLLMFVVVMALVGMTLVIPGNGTTQAASVPKPQETGYRYGYAGDIPHGRPARKEFPHSWWFGSEKLVCRRGELVVSGPVRRIYSASWALIPVGHRHDFFSVPLRTDSSRSYPVAPWHGHIDMPQPELVIRQWPRLPLLVELPSQETVTTPAEVPMRQGVESIFCATYETLVFQAAHHFTLRAGQCVLVHVDGHQWLLDVALPAGVPSA